jgi:hypothetical protein
MSRYPVDMPWEHLIWVLRPGDLLRSPTGDIYAVSKTTLLPLPGELPIVELRKVYGNSYTEGGLARELPSATPPDHPV